MSNYKIILDKDDIVLKKKDNTFKLEAKKNVKFPCKIIDMVESMEIYNLFKLLNEKIVSKCKIIREPSKEPEILLCLKNFMNEDDESVDEDDENYYITFTNRIIKNSSTSISVDCIKNNTIINKDGWKKIEIDNMQMNVELMEETSELVIKLKFTYIGDKMPIYAENTIGLIFRKIVKNLMGYFSK